MDNFKWVRPEMNLLLIKNIKSTITICNSGNLHLDFYKYSQNFYNAAEYIMNYLLCEASERQDIAKLDLWYFAIIYLYRHSLELMLKSAIFKSLIKDSEKMSVIGNVRHDLKQSLEMLIELNDIFYENNENAKWITEYLSDISRIDRESDMFRYPFDHNLKELFEKQTHISLVLTQQNMTKAYKIIKNLCDCGTFSDDCYISGLPKLIIEGGTYYQQSVVGYKYSTFSFYPYFSSYQKVGKFLSDVILVEKREDFFMPMCYLYRNAIELALKRLIVEDSHIEMSKALKIIHRKKHSILGLWNSIVEEIKEYSNAPDDDHTIKDTQIYIQSFHDFDQNSDKFRYPCDKTLKPYFLKGKKLDVENVSNCFEELCNFLDAVDGMLSTIKDYEAEMASYYADYY